MDLLYYCFFLHPIDFSEFHQMGALQTKKRTKIKITDLNDDCLMQIFGHLDLKSLFNVAIANEWLRPAAAMVYKKRFGNNEVQMSNSSNYYNRNHSFRAGKEENTTIAVSGLKSCLLYLRCFGSSIIKLKVDYELPIFDKRYVHLHRYINTYCADSLSEMAFW